MAALALYNFKIYYRSGKHNIDANSISRIKWPESVVEVVVNRNSCIGVNCNIVHAVFKGTSIPYVYAETISKSAKVVPESYLDNNGSMTLDKWKVEQSKDPTLCFLFQSLKQFQLHDGILYRKVFSDKHGKWVYLLQLILPSQLTDQVLKDCHDEACHLGRDKALELLRERFYWPSMYTDAVHHLSNYTSCLKRNGVAPKAELCLITPSRTLE